MVIRSDFRAGKSGIAASLLFVLAICFLPPGAAAEEELPVPALRNSLIISIEHPVTDAAEVEYIKNNFPWGLYAWLSFSKTVVVPNLAWKSDWNDADSGIQAFKNEINSLVAAAENAGVYLHPVLCSGLARILWIYREAKIEDVRNAQWYNDNKIASDGQIVDAQVLDKHVFGTLSRYARKTRRNLEAKARAAAAFLRQRLNEKPHVFAAFSGWGEVELNFGRLDPMTYVQEWFCDYSPFAVLEFRDWIRHLGMYDGVNGKYKGEGWAAGGARYQGAGGLTQFNADFGTAFASWDLKFWNWSLDDDWDEDPTDDVNNDPGRIPYASYVHGGMMPESGPGLIAGGFDPPRVMAPGEAFWDLWNLFRETLVRNFVLDMARWSHEAGIPAGRWYSHQIPADYIFGTNPSMEHKNARYYTSASPLWTADIVPFGRPGATIYDVKFPGWFARTSQYVLPPVRAMSSNWAALEYDAEAYPPGLGVTQSSVGDILAQYLKVYGYSPQLINFWRWRDGSGQHQIKGMNKEQALREFVGRVRDKARRDPATVFTPPKVADISGGYDAGASGVRIGTNGLIWEGHPWKWKEWGDFAGFEVHRGTVSGFAVGAGSLVGTTTDDVFDDGTAVYGRIYYYRLRAVNAAGQPGPASDEIMVYSAPGPVPGLGINRTQLNFGAVRGGVPTSPQNVVVSNTGEPGSILNWTASGNRAWLQPTPASGQGGGVVSIRVDPQGLEPGSYAGRVRIEADALNSPQFVDVRFDVYAPGASKAPFGIFDTPVDGALVYGAIPVTGWALDDVEVVKVEIRRSSVPGDHPSVIDGEGLVFISDALFVEGARPDVEPHYPNAPLNYRAGWGYMLLTNMMPNQGNGSFVLHAFAFDREGTRVKLGRKAIVGDNANSKKPFGTIDTPAQGGAASGAAYLNFGWALTPQPNMIPVDGKTITVWVDGVFVGKPSYGHYRDDIAALFPGLANSNGAVGLYHLDTTALANGVHTIAWGVTDDAGNDEGLGSRYFSVLNLDGAAEIEGAGAATGRGAESPAAGRDGDISAGGRLDSPLRLRRDFTKTKGSPASVGEILGLALRVEAVGVRCGYAERETGRSVAPDERGVVRLEIREVERIEVALDPRAAGGFGFGRAESAMWPGSRGLPEMELRPGSGEGGAAYAGYLVVGEELRPLPIGSSLDPGSGIFSWQPGPGFLGEYTLVFVRTGADGTRRRTSLLITIHPLFYPALAAGSYR